MFNIGVLHTSCDGRPTSCQLRPVFGAASLAARLSVLGSRPLSRIRSGQLRPPIIFPGNLQGRSIRETGLKGAVVVEVEDGEVSNFSRLHLARIQWALISADLTGGNSEEEAFEVIRGEIQKEVNLAGGTPVVFRMVLSGSTPLHRMLHAEPGRVVDEVLAAANHCSDAIWLQSVNHLSDRLPSSGLRYRISRRRRVAVSPAMPVSNSTRLDGSGVRLATSTSKVADPTSPKSEVVGPPRMTYVP
jgi:exonuclease SbcD